MQKNKTLKSIGILALLLLAFLLVQLSKNQQENIKEGIVAVKTGEVSPYLNSNIEIKTFQIDSSTTPIRETYWGYDITIDGTLYIHQPTIPSLPGDKGFKTEEDAKKVAELAVSKIRENIMPPGITPEELIDLDIHSL